MAAYYIAGDWGSTCLRLYLVEMSSGDVIAERKGDGVNEIASEQIPEQFRALTADWVGTYKTQHALLCGMVGSNAGWVDAGYCSCPHFQSHLAQQIKTLALDDMAVHIIPGLTCHNILGRQDFMRGEETQLAGALQIASELQQGEQLVCLPGTHCKWVQISKGQIASFITSLGGELFGALSDDSVLVKNSSSVEDKPSFIEGVLHTARYADVDLLYLLFETRSRQLQQPALVSARSFLSGLIIGRDLSTAVKLFKLAPQQVLTFIGEPTLTSRYQLAAEQIAVKSAAISGPESARAGLRIIHQALHATNRSTTE